jgi:FemAB-related protein (PEP-CTERM system-associated)
MSAFAVEVAAASIAVRDRAPAEVCNAYVAGRLDATAYHLPAWLGIVGRAFGHDTSYLVAECDGRVAGVLPLVFFSSRLFGRFAVSLPFFNYGGVLADSDIIARALLRRAIEQTQQAGGTHLELRHRGTPLFPELPSRLNKVAMELSLQPTIDRQWQALDRKLRNQVRKAEKSGLSAEVGGLELLHSFYAVFARNMRDLGTPVYGIGFFREVLSTFPERSRVVCVRHDGRPVAASIVHWTDARIEVPWASALREFNPVCANVLLYWTMLKFAIDKGLPLFDFGRSTRDHGTFHFKKQWGATPVQLVWEYWSAEGHPLPDFNPDSPRFQLAVRTWQRLPTAVTKIVGPRIVRNIP